MDKKYYFKDGELVIEKPKKELNKSKISVKSVFSIGLGAIVLILVLAVFLLPMIEESQAVNVRRIYTPTSQTICKTIDNKNVCNKVIYSGVKFIYEDNQWKDRSEARSFKGSSIKCEVDFDGKNVANCIDWNETSRTIEFSTTDQFIISSKDVKLRKYKLIYDNKISDFKRVYDEPFEKDVTLTSSNKEKTLLIKADVFDLIEYGPNSTTIQINESDSEVTDDTYVRSDQPNSAFGAESVLESDAQSARIQRLYWRFNITGVPAGKVITNATFAVKQTGGSGGTRQYTIHHAFNQTWQEGPTAGGQSWPILIWNNQICGTNFDDSDNCNLTAEDNKSIDNSAVWRTFKVKDMFTTSYNNGDINFSIALKDDDENEGASVAKTWFAKETASPADRPYLNVTYEEPNQAPIVNLQFPKNVTNTTTQFINFTYNVTDPEADSIDTCIFSLFKSGSWEQNQTDSSITQTVNQSFNLTFEKNGESVKWVVGCNDTNGNAGNASIFNITYAPILPVIQLQAPVDNDNVTTKFINFTYNTSIESGTIDDCSLILNEELNTTDSSITTDVNQSINITLSNTHDYNWTVQCTSGEGFKANATKRFLRFNTLPGNITTLSPANNTDIVASSQDLTCSGSTDSEDTVNVEFYGGNSSSNMPLLQNSSSTTFTWSGLNASHYFWRCRPNDNITNGSFTEIRDLTKVDLITNCTSNGNATAARAINFSFADENGTRLTDATFDGTFTYWGTDASTTRVKTHTSFVNETVICISPPDDSLNANTSIDYSKTGYTLRSFLAQGTVNNISDNITLYLLATADGIFVTFQVVNPANQPLSDVAVFINRTVGAQTQTIFSKLTDDAGLVVPFLNPDVQYTLLFQKAGFDDFITTLFPTQSAFTITMGQQTQDLNQTEFSKAIKFEVLPVPGTLANDTSTTFSFNVTSAFFNIEQAGFNLTNLTGSLITSATCTGSAGCIASTTINTGKNTTIVMNYFWTILGNLSIGKRAWQVQTTYQGNYSIAHFFKNDLTLLGAGFSDFTKGIIVIFSILLIVGLLTIKAGITSPLAIVGEIFAIVAFYDVVDFLPKIPGVTIDYFITIIVGLIFLGMVILEFKR